MASAFFLFDSAGELFFVCVFTTSHSVVTGKSRLEVNLREFPHDYIWDAQYRRRLVVPILEEVS